MEDEERMGNLVRRAYGPVYIPPGVKKHVRARLIAEIDSCSEGSGKLWNWTRLIISILAGVAGGLIAYGYWVSQSVF